MRNTTICFEEPSIEFDIEDLIDMFEVTLMGALEDVIGYLGDVFWSFVPGNGLNIFSDALLPLILIGLMCLPIKIMLERSRG